VKISKELCASFNIVAVGEFSDFLKTKVADCLDTIFPAVVVFFILAKPPNLVAPSDDVSSLLIEFTTNRSQCYC